MSFSRLEKHVSAIFAESGQAYGSMTAGKVANLIGALIQKRMRADEIVTFQVGTHPLLTASPIAHQVENAAEIALTKL